MDPRDVLDFLAEVGHLKRVDRSGWWLAGIPEPESVAEHVYRTTVLGHLLARMEGVDPLAVLLMTLYHDLPEARLNDLHRLAKRYVDLGEAEQRVRSEQLPGDPALRGEIEAALRAFEERSSPEADVARDADVLECVLQGREYLDAGFRQAEEWCRDKLALLRTESARLLYRRMEGWDSAAWRRDPRGIDP